MNRAFKETLPSILRAEMLTQASMNKVIDVLVVGGSKELCAEIAGIGQHQRFSFSGLSKAYQLIPRCNTIILLPDEAIYQTMPTAQEINGFNTPGFVHPAFLQLGIAPSDDQTPLPERVKQYIDLIITHKKEKKAFRRLAASVFLENVINRTFNVVNSGGTVYMLLPENIADPAKANAEFVWNSLPGISISRDLEWSDCVSGDFSWLLKPNPSSLIFSLSDSYEDRVRTEGRVSISNPLPYPETILKMLPDQASVSIHDVAVDRAKQHRVLSLQWGSGRFIIAPATCLTTLLERLKTIVLNNRQSAKNCTTETSLQNVGSPAELRPAAVDDYSLVLIDKKIWHISFGEKKATLRNYKGLRYIAALLEHPGDEILAEDLEFGYGDNDFKRGTWRSAKMETLEQRIPDCIMPGDAQDGFDPAALDALRFSLDEIVAKKEEIQTEIDELTRDNMTAEAALAKNTFARLSTVETETRTRIEKMAKNKERSPSISRVGKNIRDALKNMRKAALDDMADYLIGTIPGVEARRLSHHIPAEGHYIKWNVSWEGRKE